MGDFRAHRRLPESLLEGGNKTTELRSASWLSGKELTAKSDGLSSTLGTHMVEKINFFVLITY